METYAPDGLLEGVEEAAADRRSSSRWEGAWASMLLLEVSKAVRNSFLRLKGNTLGENVGKVED